MMLKDIIIKKIMDTVLSIVCDARRRCREISTSASTATTTVMTCTLGANNLAVGTVNEIPVTYGGYSNTFDRVIVSAYCTLSKNYYLLKGKLSNNKTTISGKFYNFN